MAVDTVNQEARELDSSADTKREESTEERKGLSSVRLPVSPECMSVSALIQFLSSPETEGKVQGAILTPAFLIPLSSAHIWSSVVRRW